MSNLIYSFQFARALTHTHARACTYTHTHTHAHIFIPFLSYTGATSLDSSTTITAIFISSSLVHNFYQIHINSVSFSVMLYLEGLVLWYSAKKRADQNCFVPGALSCQLSKCDREKPLVTVPTFIRWFLSALSIQELSGERWIILKTNEE